MKKVLVLNPYFPTLGGGEKHMAYLCKLIEEYYKNVKIDILVFNYNNIDIHSEDYPTIQTLADRFNINLTKTALLKVDFDKCVSKYDHYKRQKQIEEVTSHYDLFINFMFLSKHAGKAKKNIYICMFPPQKYKFNNLFENLLGRYFDYKFISSYDYFISNSAFTNHWFEKYWQRSNRNRLIYPPVFLEEDIEANYQEKDKKNIILSVGRFFVGAHNKKQDFLVRFFKENLSKFGGWEFHLVGAVSNYEEDIAYVNSIKESAEGFPIFLHLNCSFDKVRSLYQQSKIFWHATGYEENDTEFPDKMEHFGITTVEAMSYGVVPIVINKGGQTEIVEDGISGFLWDTERECIEKTTALLNNESLRKEMAQLAKKRAYCFSIEEFYRKSEEILNEL